MDPANPGQPLPPGEPVLRRAEPWLPPPVSDAIVSVPVPGLDPANGPVPGFLAVLPPFDLLGANGHGKVRGRDPVAFARNPGLWNGGV